jgi:hypothetical protein
VEHHVSRVLSNDLWVRLDFVQPHCAILPVHFENANSSTSSHRRVSLRGGVATNDSKVVPVVIVPPVLRGICFLHSLSDGGLGDFSDGLLNLNLFGFSHDHFCRIIERYI